MSAVGNEGLAGGRSVLAPRTTMKGEIETPGSVEIGGDFEGRVKADSLVIEETGTMKGHADAVRVTVRGQYQGEIATEELRILSGASVSGTVRTRRLTIEAGADVDFGCRMA